jgi:hypothetical protein
MACTAYFLDCVGVLKYSHVVALQSRTVMQFASLCVYSLAVPACTLVLLHA